MANDDMNFFFVLSSNRIEKVGTQDEDGTREVLQQPHKRTRFSIQIERETRQTKDAVDFIETLWSEVNEVSELTRPHNKCRVALLTVPNILESHRLFMKGLIPNAGEVRTTEVCTLTDKGVHYYEVAYKAGPALQGLVDRLNLRIVACKTVADVLSIATEWLLEFLNIHPFSDGNGRVGRLWLAYLLFSYFPFVISIPWGLRDDYIAALEANSKEKLAAVIEQSVCLAVTSFDKAMRRPR